jgi:spore maturation protein CgeB
LIQKKCIFTNWSGDIRNEASKELIKIAPAVDHTFISSTGQIELYKSAGVKNVGYWQIGYDPDIFYPEKNYPIQYEMAFAANAYAPGTFPDASLRSSIASELKNKLGKKFALYGSGYSFQLGKISPLPFNKINALYNSSRTILSVNNFNDVEHYFSDRLLICLASGRPVISYRFPQSETYFTHGTDYLVANSKEEILDLLDFCQKNPEISKKIGLQGAQKVKLQHTYQSRIAELLYLIGL